jgi:putative ABC transport system permease protein
VGPWDPGGTISIRLAAGELPMTIARIEQLYGTVFPGKPFAYFFADQEFDRLYQNDHRFAGLFGVFAGLAMVTACLGLFGLAAYAAGQRTKEIGVRKVLGASPSSIVALLSKDFARLVLVAFVVAAPIAYLAMQRWLDGFAYRIQLGPGPFLLTGAVVLAIALLTVSYQAIRAALIDPVKSLRYE